MPDDVDAVRVVEAGTPSEPIVILYTNWRGETAVRRIALDFIAYGNEALGFGWGSNQWHPKGEMLLTAFDVDKGARRTFALSGIRAWGREAVDAALSAPPAAQDGWQDITTRPNAEETYADLPGDAREGVGFAIHEATEEVQYLVWWKHMGGGVSETTHWRPLPAPPSA